MLLPAIDPDYRRLMLWSYGLIIRVRMMEWLVVVAVPYATLGLVAKLRHQSELLSLEVAALKRAVRARHGSTGKPVMPQPGAVPTDNPWL